jgi:5-carboxymethyl-2-hydroxymuconate isomerase
VPHIVIECSDNLRERCDLESVVETTHAAALEVGIFPIGGTRTRLIEYPAGRYRIADGDPENAFLAVVVRIARGRDLATRQRAGQAIFDAVCESLGDAYVRWPLAIALEVQEIDPDVSFKKSNLHDYVVQRSGAGASTA